MLLGQISLNFPFNFGGLQHDKDSGYAPDFTLDGSEYSNTTQENSLKNSNSKFTLDLQSSDLSDPEKEKLILNANRYS